MRPRAWRRWYGIMPTPVGGDNGDGGPGFRNMQRTVLQSLARKGRAMALEALLGRRVRVFGSVARGEADAESDVDFLVELDPGRSLLDLGGLQFELEALLGRPVDVVTERGLKARIREQVLREAVAV